MLLREHRIGPPQPRGDPWGDPRRDPGAFSEGTARVGSLGDTPGNIADCLEDVFGSGFWWTPDPSAGSSRILEEQWDLVGKACRSLGGMVGLRWESGRVSEEQRKSGRGTQGGNPRRGPQGGPRGVLRGDSLGGVARGGRPRSSVDLRVARPQRSALQPARCVPPGR